jgi:hypothetical protein
LPDRYCGTSLLYERQRPRLIVSDRASDLGGAEGNRTPDLLDANESRYQLRHSPISGTVAGRHDLSRRSLAGCTAVAGSGRAVEVVELGVFLVDFDE